MHRPISNGAGMWLITPACTTCVHRSTVHPLFCTAFPDGIPTEICAGEHDHRTPFEGDHGIQYSPRTLSPEEIEYHARLKRLADDPSNPPYAPEVDRNIGGEE